MDITFCSVKGNRVSCNADAVPTSQITHCHDLAGLLSRQSPLTPGVSELGITHDRVVELLVDERLHSADKIEKRQVHGDQDERDKNAKQDDNYGFY